MPQPDAALPVIVPTNSGALTTATGPQRIATRMAENLLDVARSQERAQATQRRYRVGDYEFRAADYAQIQRWAEILGMEPEKVVAQLKCGAGLACRFSDDLEFKVNDGIITSMVWDFDLLPLTDWMFWKNELQIEDLGIVVNTANAPLDFSLSILPKSLCNLVVIYNDNYRFNIIDVVFNQMPRLKKFHCDEAVLQNLDLIPMPGLQELSCSGNGLTALNLTPVLRLQELDCSRNSLTALDLTPVPRLQELDCSGNGLTALDLTPVTGLQYLRCDGNRLTELDLTPVPKLGCLQCDASVNIKGAPPNLKVYH